MTFDKEFNFSILESLKILKAGNCILYPTETVWGIGCDATNKNAIEKIYQIKERPSEKSLIVLVSSITMLKEYVQELNQNIISVLETFPKPLTIIYPNVNGLAKNIYHADGSVGIRIIKQQFCEQLITTFGKPIVSTSANLSGEATPLSFNAISPDILNRVDYIVNLPSFKGNGIPSTIAKFDKEGKLIIVRP